MTRLEENMEGFEEHSNNCSDSKLSAVAKVMLVTDKAVFGPGPVRLLHNIAKTGAVSAACAAMNLAYSKGWQLLNKMEEELGFKVIKRFHGGAGGGKSELTANGKLLMEKYEELEKRTQNCLNDFFEEIFSDLEQWVDEEE